MPVFFFDLQDGSSPDQDDTGLEMPSAEFARQEAVASLLSMARYELRDDRRSVTIKVRNSLGHPILTASLSLNISLENAG